MFDAMMCKNPNVPLHELPLDQPNVNQSTFNTCMAGNTNSKLGTYHKWPKRRGHSFCPPWTYAFYMHKIKKQHTTNVQRNSSSCSDFCYFKRETNVALTLCYKLISFLLLISILLPMFKQQTQQKQITQISTIQ